LTYIKVQAHTHTRIKYY